MRYRIAAYLVWFAGSAAFGWGFFALAVLPANDWLADIIGGRNMILVGAPIIEESAKILPPLGLVPFVGRPLAAWTGLGVVAGSIFHEIALRDHQVRSRIPDLSWYMRLELAARRLIVWGFVGFISVQTILQGKARWVLIATGIHIMWNAYWWCIIGSCVNW